MKAEIYSVVDKSFKPASLDKKMNWVTNQLREADIEILYKTDLEADKIKLLEALRQSYSVDEGIQLIIIANALDGTSDCDTLKLFKKLCPKHTENAENAEYDEDNGDENISDYKDKGDLENLATEFEADDSKKKKTSTQTAKRKVVNEIWSTGDLGKGYEGCFILYDNKMVLALPKESLAKVSTAELIIAGAKKATSARGITTGNIVSGKVSDHFDYYSIAQDKEEVKKKKGFFASIFPSKGDKPLEVVRKVVLMIASVTFIITAIVLCKLLFVEPAQVEEDFDVLRKIAHSVKVNSDTDQIDSDGEPAEKLDRFAQLKAINPEIVGWIYIPNTTYIDYPVLDHDGDGPYSQYYLHRDYKGNPSSYGSIFLDYRSENSVNSKNVILHGHNMDNGMVFHQLLSYSNLSFYQSTPVIQFDTPDFDADWKIISVFKTNTVTSQGEFFNYLRGEFENDTEFMDFVYNIMERSIIDTGVTVNEDDQLLTLSTCSYEFNNFRTVIVARRVRKGEDSKVDVSKAKLNPDAVWPQCYYAKNGGQRKELTDFITASRAGDTPWYDGDYKLDKKDIRKDDTDSETGTEDEEKKAEEERIKQEEEERQKQEEEERQRQEEEERQRQEEEERQKQEEEERKKQEEEERKKQEEEERKRQEEEERQRQEEEERQRQEEEERQRQEEEERQRQEEEERRRQEEEAARQQSELEDQSYEPEEANTQPENPEG